MLKDVLRFVTTKYPFIQGRSKLTQAFSKYLELENGTKVCFDNNLQIEINPKQFVSKEIFLFGIFEPLESAVFNSVIKPGMVVIDVGGNIGQYTLLAAKRVGASGCVHVFEPSFENCEIIRRNVELNGFSDRVVLHKMALASEVKVGELVLTEDGGSNYITTVNTSYDTQKTVEVKCVTLDHYFSVNNLHKIDVLKIDTEGADFEVLRGATNVLRKFGPVLFVEFAERVLKRFGTTPNDMLSYLRSLSYKPYKFSKDGLKLLNENDDISNTNLYFSKS